MSPVELMTKLADGSASAADKDAFQAYLRTLDERGYSLVLDEYARLLGQVEVSGYPADQAVMVARIEQNRKAYEAGQRRAVVVRFRRMAAAAAILALLVTGGWYLVRQQKNRANASGTQDLAATITPGGNKATLTLADGSQVVLDNAHNGRLADQVGTTVYKIDSGSLAYRSSGAQHLTTVNYNSITTPIGGQYNLILPDGTHVWLNAASSLRFPTVFSGRDRRVELQGEAYFEVAAHANQPFIVHVAGNEAASSAASAVKTGSKAFDVLVLGTHFNIMAYQDEPVIRTTLQEGKVRVSADGQDRILQPGEQARLASGNPLSVATVDPNAAIAWKNGQFNFEAIDIPEIMRQLARWYDIRIEYDSTNHVSTLFNGSIARSASLSNVLQMLEMTGEAHFELRGRTVVITK